MRADAGRGLGTFQPIHSETLEGPRHARGAYEIPNETAERIGIAQREGRPILAIGTTVVRALEDAALRAAEREQRPTSFGKAETRLFIIPGFNFAS